MSKRRQSKSVNWRREQQKNLHTKTARLLGYRSRAALKLMEIDDAHHILQNSKLAVDLGSAPGGWSQVMGKRMSAAGRIIAVDLLPMAEISGVFFLQADFFLPTVRVKISEYLEGLADLVVSDMSPNLSGVAVSDQSRAAELGLAVVQFCSVGLCVGGNLLIKSFQGEEQERVQTALTKGFRKVKAIRPKATRTASKELYLLALGRC